MRAILLGAFILAMVTPADAQGRHRGHYHGDGFAGGVIGGVIGGVLGGVISRPQYYPRQSYGDAVAYCIQRYRSYNPETGIWIGYDGVPRRCP